MRELHGLRTGQVGNRAGQFQAAVDAAARPAQACRGGVQEFRRRIVEPALRVDGFALQRLVAAALAGQGAFAGGHHALPDRGAAFTRRRVDQFVGRQRADFDVDIDAVQQGAAELALVT